MWVIKDFKAMHSRVSFDKLNVDDSTSQSNLALSGCPTLEVGPTGKEHTSASAN